MIKQARAVGVIGLVVGFAAVGCGDKSGGGAASGSAAAAGGKVASCNTPAAQTCKEFGPKNVEAAGMDYLKKFCSGMGDFKETACPTEKIIGVCTSSEGKTIYYEGSPGSADSNEKTCKVLGGTYSTK